MKMNDILAMYRFLGFLDGLATSLPHEAKIMLGGHMEVVEDVLEKEEAEKDGEQNDR